MSANFGPSPETLRALETAPNMYLVLSPELIILTASDLYLQAIKASRESIVGKHIFEAFPDNPDLPYADGVQNINASLQAVLQTKKADRMRIQRYDVPDLDRPGGFIRRYWDPSHTPVLDDQGKIIYIIQLATDVTEKIIAEHSVLTHQLLETTGQIKDLNAELLAKNVELRETQHQLSILNAQLEERVNRRTEELAKANMDQAAVNEEMTATNEELTEIQWHLEETNRELARGASRLRMAVELTGLGTWELIPATGELYWSNECREIFGLTYGQPANFDDYIRHIHPDDKEWVSERIQKTLEPGSDGQYELSHRIIRSDNHDVRWIIAQGTVDFDQHIAVRFMGTVLDITERKKVEEQSARLAAIVATSNDAIISKTLESIITTWNDSAQRIFGYTADEMIGESIYKLIPPDRLDEEPMILSRLNNGERMEHFETRRLRKDGKQIDVSLTVSPITDSQGNIIGLSKIARDISERKQDEVRKNDFIGMVSHELKTPLTSLNAILQVLNSKLRKSEDPFIPGALERANHQVKKMSNLINGFLDISRLESGKMMIDKQAFVIGDLIAEVIGEVNLTGLSHIIELHHCDKVVVVADRDKINSVLANLLSNAVKYSPKGTSIYVDCLQFDNEVRISVSDQGLGIRPEDCAHIFDRYYRVESNRTRHISGFGIGLYLSAEIIQHHGGRIWVESQSGQGSTFYFTLPVGQRQAS